MVKVWFGGCLCGGCRTIPHLGQFWENVKILSSLVMTKFLYTFVLSAWIVGAVENDQHHCDQYDHDQEWLPLNGKTTFKVQLCLSQPESLFVNKQLAT